MGLLCALAAAVFATVARDRYGALTLAAGFLIGSAWLQPGPGWTGAVVAATAGLSLVRPGGAPAARIAPLVAGLVGGLWSRVLGGYGLPVWLAWSAGGRGGRRLRSRFGGTGFRVRGALGS